MALYVLEPSDDTPSDKYYVVKHIIEVLTGSRDSPDQGQMPSDSQFPPFVYQMNFTSEPENGNQNHLYANAFRVQSRRYRMETWSKFLPRQAQIRQILLTTNTSLEVYEAEIEKNRKALKLEGTVSLRMNQEQQSEQQNFVEYLNQVTVDYE